MSDPIDPELLELRRRIDEIDARLLALLEERVNVVLRVGDWKRERGLPVYDPERERRMKEELASRARPPLEPDTVRRVFERVIDESRRLEQREVQRGRAGPPRR